MCQQVDTCCCNCLAKPGLPLVGLSLVGLSLVGLSLVGLSLVGLSLCLHIGQSSNLLFHVLTRRR